MISGSRWLWIVLVLLLAAGAVYFVKRPKPLPVDVVVAKREDVQTSVVASGRVLAPARVDVGSTITGRVQRVAVREGARVSEGQLLVQLEQPELNAALLQVRAVRDRAQARVESVSKLALPTARESQSQAESNVLLAEREWKRACYLRDQQGDGSLRACKGKTGHRPNAMLDRSLFEYGAKQCKRCFDSRRRKGIFTIFTFAFAVNGLASHTLVRVTVCCNNPCTKMSGCGIPALKHAQRVHSEAVAGTSISLSTATRVTESTATSTMPTLAQPREEANTVAARHSKFGGGDGAGDEDLNGGDHGLSDHDRGRREPVPFDAVVELTSEQIRAQLADTSDIVQSCVPVPFCLRLQGGANKNCYYLKHFLLSDDRLSMMMQLPATPWIYENKVFLKMFQVTGVCVRVCACVCVCDIRNVIQAKEKTLESLTEQTIFTMLKFRQGGP